MATITVKALQDHAHNGKAYKSGDEYEYEIADLNPDSVSLPSQVARAEKKSKETYRRRDLTAE